MLRLHRHGRTGLFLTGLSAVDLALWDLKGKALACDRKGLTGEQLSELVLKVYGLSYKDLAKVNHVSYSDGVSLMKDGHVQGFFLITTIPSSSIARGTRP